MQTSYKHFRCILLCLLLGIVVQAYAQTNKQNHCPFVKLQVDRLPDLNTPRADHGTFCFKDEIVVIGGHTDGFVSTATAEYFSDGIWHLIPTVYTHDVGFFMTMKSGKVLITGGCSEPLGIGQTFTAELYDPATHSFDGFGCMDRKRTMSSGVEIDSGHVVITGNWYHDDDIEMFDGKRSFTHVKHVAVHRSSPYVFRSAKDNAIIFSSHDTKGKPLPDIVVDRLRGDSSRVPLFNKWMPLPTSHRSEDCFIGDEESNVFQSLFPVVNEQGQIAIALVDGEHFSLLSTDYPVPMKGVKPENSKITYFTSIIADRKANCAYMLGADKAKRLYVLRIDYIGHKLTLYYTNPLTDVGFSIPALTSDGDLVMAGGITDNNFKPFSSVLLLKVGTGTSASSPISSIHPSLLIIILLTVVIIALLLWHIRRNRKTQSVDSLTDTETEKESTEDFDETHQEPSIDESEAEKTNLQASDKLESIRRLMEDQKLFLNSDLKLSNIAAELNTNSRYISDCIRTQCDCTFTQLVNNYRIDYAKQLMDNHPDMKIAEVALSSGFSNETTFFRAFKKITGLSPKEWISTQHPN